MARRITLISCLAVCALLTVFSTDAAQAARSGFSLFLNAVMPALLPYFICASLMTRCASSSSSAPWLMIALSLISGAPSGARFAASIGDDDPRHATRVAAALNAASPAFISGVFCGACLGRPALAAPLLISQYVSALIMLIPLIKRMRIMRLSPAPPSLPEAIRSSMEALISICGTIVFFSVMIRLMDITRVLDAVCFPAAALVEAFGGSGAAVRAVAIGLVEMVTGTNALAACGLNIRTVITLSAALFAFGGLCVMAQSLSFLELNALTYILYKLIQAAAAGGIAFLITPLFLGAEPAISLLSADRMLNNAAVALAALISSLFGMAVVLLFAAAASGITRKAHSTKPPV